MFSKILGTILRPFVKIIRYGVLKIMKRLRQPDDKRPIIATSEHMLSEIILPSVFRIFKEKKFRKIAYFKKLSASEHDRIFNELEVAGICLAIFYLRLRKSRVRLGDYHFWQDVEEYLPGQLKKILIGYGVESSNAKQMCQLIDMRRKEYEEFAEKIKETDNDLKAKFQNLTPEIKGFSALMHATVVSTADHIRRGKLKEKDPLIHYLTKQFVDIQRKIMKFVKNL